MFKAALHISQQRLIISFREHFNILWFNVLGLVGWFSFNPAVLLFSLLGICGPTFCSVSHTTGISSDLLFSKRNQFTRRSTTKEVIDWWSCHCNIHDFIHLMCLLIFCHHLFAVFLQSWVFRCPCLNDEYHLLPPGGKGSYFLLRMYNLSDVFAVSWGRFFERCNRRPSSSLVLWCGFHVFGPLVKKTTTKNCNTVLQTVYVSTASKWTGGIKKDQ